MDCPYCGKEMTLGYIECRDGVYWTAKKHLIKAFSCFGKDSTPLSNGASDYANTVYAYKCGHCRKVVIDYSKEAL